MVGKLWNLPFARLGTSADCDSHALPFRDDIRELLWTGILNFWNTSASIPGMTIFSGRHSEIQTIKSCPTAKRLRLSGRKLLNVCFLCQEPPTAFMCHNDHWAPAVYRAVRAHGLRIPADVAVMGFVAKFDHESLAPSLILSTSKLSRRYAQCHLLAKKALETPNTQYVSEITYELQIRASTAQKKENKK